MPSDLEAVQFGEFAPWHAVRPDDGNKTLCGRSALTAARMWFKWAEVGEAERCSQCLTSPLLGSRA